MIQEEYIFNRVYLSPTGDILTMVGDNAYAYVSYTNTFTKESRDFMLDCSKYGNAIPRCLPAEYVKG